MQVKILKLVVMMISIILLFLVVQICSGEVLNFQKYPNYVNHRCKRDCVFGEPPLRCYYELNYDIYFSMQPDCLNCTNGVPGDCSRPDCIPADGRQRPVYVYNGYLPGPAIEVCEFDEIVVDVINQMDTDTTTVHWHGMHQRNSQFMDGVPAITQYPIGPKQTFRYHFRADPHGTNWYHTHSGSQRADGAFGYLIVRQPDILNVHRSLYDYDLSEHAISVLDWLDELTDILFIRYLRTKQFYDTKFTALLVNGFGASPTNNVPQKIFSVDAGMRYRFRVVHAGNAVCPVEISVDGHTMQIISSDGHDIEPVFVDSLVVTNGERFDFVLSADQPVDNYVMRFAGSIICNVSTTAILHYNGATDETTTRPNLDIPPVLTGNCVNVRRNSACFNYDNMTSVQPLNKRYRRKPDIKYFIGFDSVLYSAWKFRGVNSETLVAPFINNISFTAPTVPLMLSPPRLKQNFCNAYNRKNCDGTHCHCTHTLQVPLNALVEFIFVDEASIPDLNLQHPMHLHGYSFRVLAQDRLGQSVTVDHVKQLDAAGLLERNFDNPILKDTISVPHGGYVIVRFIADNPGYWLLHCHIDFHAEEGMMMVVKVGNPPSPPIGFPTCGSYTKTNPFI